MNDDYKMIEYEGQEARLYPNGSIKNMKGQYIVLSPDEARRMRNIRKQKAEEQARLGMQNGTMSNTPEEAVMKIIRAKTIVAMNDMGRAGNDAAKLVLQASGYLSNEKNVTVEDVTPTQQIPQLPKEFTDYLKRIAEQSERELIDGVIIEEQK